MTEDAFFASLQALVQQDIGGRGLARDPHDNLLTATPHDLQQACRAIALPPEPRLGVVTGFMIPSATPPTGETDGPLGALFLATTCAHLGIPCHLLSDAAGVAALRRGVAVRELPTSVLDLRTGRPDLAGMTHLIALERSGPSHVDGRNYTMRGRDITPLTAPAHELFEGERPYVTIGIGDGGNEIGMGKIAPATIAKNIPHGDRVHCRTATDYLIVAGISNWGAYALAAGLMYLRQHIDLALFDADRDEALLADLVTHGPLVDGVTGQFTVSVDGLDFPTYRTVLEQIRIMLANSL